MSPFLSSREAPADYMALRIYSRHSLGYELSFGASLVKVGRLGAENNCCKQIDTTQINMNIFLVIGVNCGFQHYWLTNTMKTVGAGDWMEIYDLLIFLLPPSRPLC